MGFDRYVDIARNTYRECGAFDIDTSAINLTITLKLGQPTQNTLLNQSGTNIAYIHARMRQDDDPSAVYEDASDGVWYPLKGRVVAVSPIADPKLLTPPYDAVGDGLLLYPGQQLKASYQGKAGQFVLIRNRQHPYDLSLVCGLRINGFWKLRLD